MSTRPATRNYTAKAADAQTLALLKELLALPIYSSGSFSAVLKNWRKSDGSLYTKDEILAAYRQWAHESGNKPDRRVIEALKLKPMRTQSGVAPVTVLTKPFPCPGECIFCPNDIRMPKSYLSDEPGAQRAERNYFDPYLQTYNRLQALHNIGHSLDKVELIVLGGTWSLYPESYQIWFITECFRAMNDFPQKDLRVNIEERYQSQLQKLKEHEYLGLSNNPTENVTVTQKYEIDGATFSKTYNSVVSSLYVGPEKKLGFDQLQTATWNELQQEYLKNETAMCRCVGLVVETRPDAISQTEVIRLRKLGCTKTQIGVQSLNDEVLQKNNRGHDVLATKRAFALLRQAGFKIHAHWMANLYGSSVKKDKEDFLRLFSDPAIRPDELKIYPCSLIASAELMQYYQDGRWKPYEKDELLEVVSFALTHTSEYCRLTRVIRDIPSTDIVEGNKLTNFRQIAEQNVKTEGEVLKDIRAREIRDLKFEMAEVQLKIVPYQTEVSQEYFLQLIVSRIEKDVQKEYIVGFLRLSLPTQENYIQELKNVAMIRELHVYGQLAELEQKAAREKLGAQKAQHSGFGTWLLHEAQKISTTEGYQKLAVISAIGTREYYRKKGFVDGELYQFFELPTGFESKMSPFKTSAKR